MRILKAVIWDLDETLLAGILAEGDKEANPQAERCLTELEKHGVLQALATQNQPEIIPPALDFWDGQTFSSRWSSVWAHLEYQDASVAKIDPAQESARNVS